MHNDVAVHHSHGACLCVWIGGQQACSADNADSRRHVSLYTWQRVRVCVQVNGGGCACVFMAWQPCLHMLVGFTTQAAAAAAHAWQGVSSSLTT